MTKLSVKYNDSCVRLFEFLKMLSKGEATYKEVISLFSEDNNEKCNPNVTLNKYLNTLKIFGINIRKTNHKFYLLNSPCKIDLSKNDLQAVQILKKSVLKLSSEKARLEFALFISALEIHYSEKTLGFAELLGITDICTGIKTSQDEHIKILEKHIENNCRLTLIYIDKNGKEIKTTCDPVEIRYRKEEACFCIHSHSGNRYIEIPVKRIQHISALPEYNNRAIKSATVSYKIKGSLAKRYTLREWESSPGPDQHGDIIIINSNEDFDILTRRLLKYGSNCQVISPKALQERMIELIEETLNKYK